MIAEYLNHPLLLRKKHHLKLFEKSLLTKKIIEKINLYRIFYDSLVEAGFPITSPHFDTPTLVYT